MAGGTGALGQAVVAELIASGYACTVTWVVDEERRRTEQEFGDRVTLVHADLFGPAGAGKAVAAVDDLEAIVNLVGGFAMGGLVHETEPAGYPFSVVQGMGHERFDLITPDRNMGRANIEGWLSVEAYDTPKGADRPCFHWYVVDPTGRVWTSPDGERRTGSAL